MNVKLLTPADPEAGVMETCLNLTLCADVSVLLMFRGCSYVKVALGYAVSAKLTLVEFLPIEEPEGQSLPCTKLTLVALIVTVGAIVKE
jgi:hypothetical protein